MSITMITLFIVFLLCFGVFRFTQAWFEWPSSAYEPEVNKVEAVETFDQTENSDAGYIKHNPMKE